MATVDTVADMVDTAAGAAPHMDMVATAVTTVVSPKYDDCLHIETIIRKYIIFVSEHSQPTHTTVDTALVDSTAWAMAVITKFD